MSSNYDTALGDLKSDKSEIKTLKDLHIQFRIYGHTKEVYTTFSKTRNKDKFIRDNTSTESDVMFHKTAESYLKAYKKEYNAVPNTKEVKVKLEGLGAKKIN